MDNDHDYIDYQKLRLAKACLASCDLATIRRTSISNLDRWEASGTWCSAFDEWRAIMTSWCDDDVIAVMTGLDQRANRLRQSPPYTGLLDQKTRHSIIKMVQILRDSEEEPDPDHGDLPRPHES